MVKKVYTDGGRVRSNNEIWTPPELVNKMVDSMVKHGGADCLTDPKKTWCDPACGTGNILVVVKERLMAAGHSEESVLRRLYGVELMEDNAQECRDRLDPDGRFSDIVNLNIVTADALTYDFEFDGKNGVKAPDVKAKAKAKAKAKPEVKNDGSWWLSI